MRTGNGAEGVRWAMGSHKEHQEQWIWDYQGSTGFHLLYFGCSHSRRKSAFLYNLDMIVESADGYGYPGSSGSPLNLTSTMT